LAGFGVDLSFLPARLDVVPRCGKGWVPLFVPFLIFLALVVRYLSSCAEYIVQVVVRGVCE